MRFDHLHHHLNRRDLLKAGAAAAVATAAGSLLSDSAGAQESDSAQESDATQAAKSTGGYDDSHDVSKALDGTWAAASSARYGSDDQRGTLNEITSRKTACALRLLDGAGKVVTVNMGHTMVNGFPAFVTFPPRKWQQRLTTLGYVPDQADKFFNTTTPGNAGEDEWRQADRASGPLGYNQSSAPLGSNVLSGHEERFPEGYTFQIGTQLDNLSHIGVKEVFYNGFKANEFATPTGVAKLGVEHIGAFVTRGILIDVLGYKQKRGASSDLQTVAGKTTLAKSYRITIDDITATMKWEGIKRIDKGDVVVLRTGWGQLSDSPDTYADYLTTEPGIYLAEAKYFADHRPAVVASDSWGLEVVGNPVSGTNAFPVHQVFLTQHGIRIGEGVLSDELAEEGNHEFVYCYAPMNAVGATAGGTPPFALVRG